MSLDVGKGQNPAPADELPGRGNGKPVAEEPVEAVPVKPPHVANAQPKEAVAATQPEVLAGEAPPDEPGEQIAGIPVLKGLILYAAVFVFAGLYIYFMVDIFQAKSGAAPSFDGTLISAAAALAGVLGSAFALAIGVTTSAGETNSALHRSLAEPKPSRKHRTVSRLRRLLSIAPANTQGVSWPKTLGIWAYALVGSAVAITYITHQNETPSSIKALAVAFGGYVIALVTTAYGIKAKGARGG
jgi:hypothetical protein